MRAAKNVIRVGADVAVVGDELDARIDRVAGGAREDRSRLQEGALPTVKEALFWWLQYLRIFALNSSWGIADRFKVSRPRGYGGLRRLMRSTATAAPAK